MFKFDFDSIGTHWQIETAAPLQEPIRRQLLAEIGEFDRIFSRFRSDSLVAGMAASLDGGRFRFPGWAASLFDLYDRLFIATAGAVDPLVGRDLELLGYDGSYSLRPDPLAIAEYSKERRAWNLDVRRLGLELVTRRSVVLDIGAAGKGFLVDRLGQTLRGHGLEEFVVDGGGDMIHAGPDILRVGLEHPHDTQLMIGVANLRGRALCASAVNRRAWAEFHHILDARTGVPTQDVIATWAVTDNAAIADVLATALFFTSAKALSEQFEFSSVRMLANGRVEVSPNFDGEVFLSAEGETE
ncbi:FAD:protein FMN transferase [Rhizobium laguerreae]|uniref:FAD:protein FMN transferase n=1 Tax=Rhizobium laguerreae TaxID=1076926 RepID=UPI001C8FB34F|nr:FAD:protein FMN transferase [Rhizobium laguerreae]MBY3217652.1 FAD:protein FMN transferase [Rhizobium laguerreae]